jgi:ubiquinone/menaquinone biosynthesis C-methylase UbiE
MSPAVSPGIDLPYFDAILARLDREPDSALAQAFRRHVHWGCFRSPETADDSLATYVAAAEELTSRVCTAGRVADGQSILDVGCGFGGTLDTLCERLHDCRLLGLNIDGRQLRRAREGVPARRGNHVQFVQADAGKLPVPAARFHAVLAVECIFHFKSRKEFFKEVARVLQPGGTFALTDFVLREGALVELAKWMSTAAPPASRFSGHSSSTAPTSSSYQRLGSRSGLELLADQDITANTRPTYRAMRRLYREAGLSDGEAATDYLEEMAARGYVEYHILAFAKPSALPSKRE